MIKDLAKSKISIEAVEYEGWMPLPDQDPFLPANFEAGTTKLPVHFYVKNSYRILYPTPDGRATTMFRDRLDFKENTPPDIVKRHRYNQPSKTQIGSTAVIPFFPKSRHKNPHNGILEAIEGEKKTMSGILNGSLYAFGFGGCQNWRDPASPEKLHPWIVEELQQIGATTLRWWFDADWRTNLLVYAATVDALKATHEAGFTGVLMDLSPLGMNSKLDDLFAENHTIEEILSKARSVTLAELTTRVHWAQIQSQLLDAFPDLTFSISRAFGRYVEANEANVETILRQHPYFKGKLWIDTDQHVPMFEESALPPEDLELRILRFFQKDLEMGANPNRVTMGHVRNVIGPVIRSDQRSPFREWVEGLHWDRKRRLKTWLGRYAGVPQSRLSAEAGLKIFVALIARTFHPGCPLRWILILMGRQQIGKTLIWRLAAGSPERSVDILKSHKEKDRLMMFNMGVIVNYDELNAFTNADLATIKSEISRSDDVYRGLWDKSPSRHPRHSVSVGSTDQPEFLDPDPAGHSRYCCLRSECTPEAPMDLEGFAAEVPQLLAEAMALYRSGRVKYWQIDHMKESNSEFVRSSMEKEEMLALFHDKRISGWHDMWNEGEYRGVAVRWAYGSDICKMVAMRVSSTPNDAFMQFKVVPTLKTLGFEKAVNWKKTGRNVWLIPSAKKFW